TVAISKAQPGKARRPAARLRKSGRIIPPPSWIEHVLDALVVGNEFVEPAFAVLAQQYEDHVEQVAQGRLIQQRLDVRALVVRRYEQRLIRVRPQRIGAVPRNRNHLAAAFAELPADL